MKALQAVRGMNDITPDAIPYWHLLEDNARRVLGAYGYREIRPPIIEKTELFRRSIGEVTDIVEKEMYTFDDRNGESLTLRPECTASCVRAAVEHGLLHNQVQRLWYMGPMFRYERPQKGRYRQFHQIGAEAFGLPGPELDAELMLMTARLWSVLGLDGLRLEINSLGTRQAQARYRQLLAQFLEDNLDELDADSRRRLTSNPLRILDSKNPAMQPLIERAPRLLDHLDDESAAHFDALRRHLDGCGLDYAVSSRLVRGLDYYTRTVFEWTTDRLGSQNAVCGGGRYDGLVAEIGGQATPASGFAIGMERLVALLEQGDLQPDAENPEIYLAAVGERGCFAAHPLAERLRAAMPARRILVDAADGSFKAKLRRADRSGAAVALLLGEDEATAGTVAVKSLRDERPQQTLQGDMLLAVLNELLQGDAGNGEPAGLTR